MIGIKKEKNGFLSGALALSVSTILVKVLGVIYKVPLSYILTEEGMGYFNSAYTVYSFFYILCTAGVPKAITMLISEADGDRANESRIYKTSLTLFFALGFIITGIFILLSPALSVAVGSSKSAAAMLVIAPSILFISLSGVMRGYLTGKCSMLPIAISQLIEAALKLVLGLIFANIGKELKLTMPLISAFTILGITLGSIASCIFLSLYIKLKNNGIKVKQKSKLEKNDIIKRIIKIALPISLSSSIMSLSGLLDLGLIMRRLVSVGYSEAEATALYGNYTTLSVPMMNLIISVLTPISVAALPRLASMHFKREREGFQNTLSDTVRITAFVGALCSTLFLFFSFEVLDVLFAAGMSAEGAGLLSLLSPAVYLLSILTAVNTGHEAMQNIRIPVIALLLGCAVKTVVGVVLIGNPEFGINGAPIGTVCAYAVALVYSLIELSGRGVKLHTFKNILLPYFIAFVSTYIPYTLLYKRGLLSDNIFGIALLVGICGVIYLFLCLICGFFKSRKEC